MHADDPQSGPAKEDEGEGCGCGISGIIGIMERLESESARSPEQLNRDIETLLLSCERVGEGGKAVVLKLSPNQIEPSLNPALEALHIEGQEDKALKLLKLYLPNKSASEFKMHQKAYEALQEIPESERGSYASIPALSSMHEVSFDDDVKTEIERKFRARIIGDKSQIIAMEYIDGEDLATVFYKWILERERRYTTEEVDQMDFQQLYDEVAKTLHFESLPTQEIDDPRALELAEWKNSSTNTNKLYAYLHKRGFPLSPETVSQVENTLRLLHEKAHITHGDAFERNIMVQGGIHALREGQNRTGSASVIDFGEARDRDIEGVDDFAVVRRMKKLLSSPQEEARIEKQRVFEEMDHKTMAFLKSKTGKDKYSVIKKLAQEYPETIMENAWNRTAALGEKSIDDFFAIAKQLSEEGLVNKDVMREFALEKKKSALSAYQKNQISKGLEWLAA